MDWQSDTTAGDWLRERLDAEFSNPHGTIPRGFEAYVRVFHPLSVLSVPGERLPSGRELWEHSGLEQDALFARATETPATWADTAAAFGTTMHPLAAWPRLVRVADDEDWGQVTSPDGRQWQAPDEGHAPPELTATIVRALTGGESTDGYVALWEGSGGLVGAYGGTGRGIAVGFEEGYDPEIAWRHRQILDAAMRDTFNNVFIKPQWVDGILSREISEGPRLELPARDHVLFGGDLAVLTDAAWPTRVPWFDSDSASRGFGDRAETPALIWPHSHDWVIATDVDMDSTVIAGSRAAIDRILATDLEVAEIPEGEEIGRTYDPMNN